MLGLKEYFAHRKHPTLSAHSLIDEDAERTVMDGVVAAFERLSNADEHFVRREHDGVAVPDALGRVKLLATAHAAAPGFRFAIKEYTDPVVVASAKFPDEDFG